MPKIVAIIQARLGSNRLPAKVLKNIIGRPMIEHVVERTLRAQLVDEVVIATTDTPQDTRLASLCESNDWNVFRGSENDVLDRYWKCAKHYQADQIVRITSDCPMISPEIIDQVVRMQLNGQNSDYSCNFHPERKFPRGLDVECFEFSTLDHVNKIAIEPNLREHVTLMIYRRPDLFSVSGFECREDLSNFRWTVDTADDLKLIRTIFSHFNHNRFTWQDAAQAIHDHPHWQSINQHINQKAA
ncbi:glycosyltransferase family protein [bacterium]|nr:glycosyltransferase family protein [bacterium]